MPTCNTIPTPVKTPHGIPSTHHQNLHAGISMLSSLFDSRSTTTPSTTTPITPAPDVQTYHGYSLQCVMCGRAFKSHEDINDEYRNKNVCSSHCRHSLIALMSTHEGRRMMKVRQRTFQI